MFEVLNQNGNSHETKIRSASAAAAAADYPQHTTSNLTLFISLKTHILVYKLRCLYIPKLNKIKRRSSID